MNLDTTYFEAFDEFSGIVGAVPVGSGRYDFFSTRYGLLTRGSRVEDCFPVLRALTVLDDFGRLTKAERGDPKQHRLMVLAEATRMWVADANWAHVHVAKMPLSMKYTTLREKAAPDLFIWNPGNWQSLENDVIPGRYQQDVRNGYYLLNVPSLGDLVVQVPLEAPSPMDLEEMMSALAVSLIGNTVTKGKPKWAFTRDSGLTVDFKLRFPSDEKVRALLARTVDVNNLSAVGEEDFLDGLLTRVIGSVDGILPVSQGATL